MAALHNQHGDRRYAQQLMADAFQEASRRGPHDVLDVLEQGAPIMAQMAAGRQLLKHVHRGLMDVQSWRTVSASLDARAPTLFQTWR